MKMYNTALLTALAGLAIGASLASTSARADLILGGANARWQSSSGCLICDGHINGNSSDSFDGTMHTIVNGTFYGGSSFSVSGQTADGGLQTMSGLQVRGKAYFDTASATARMLATFVNPTANAITITLGSNTNMGSDGSGVTSATSSGNTIFDGNDRWMISQDLGTGDAVTAYILQGMGTVNADMTSVTGSAEAGAFTGMFSLTIGAGETESMMYFAQMYATVAAAQAGVVAFDTLGPNASVLGGLTATELSQIQNWSFAAVPEPISLALLGVGLAGLGFSRRRKA